MPDFAKAEASELEMPVRSSLDALRRAALFSASMYYGGSLAARRLLWRLLDSATAAHR